MKPLQKVVTAQDIESSLYYVHVDGAEDDKVRQTLLREQDHQISNGEADGNTPHSSINGVPRKALPASPQLALGNRPEPPPKLYPHYQPPASSERGRTHYGCQYVGYGASSRRANPEPSSIRPAQDLLGPRPMHQRLRSMDSAALEAVPERQNVNLRRWSEQPKMTGPPLPPRPYVRRKDVPSDQPSMDFRENGPAIPPRPNHRSQLSGYSETKAIATNGHQPEEENISLTLIRRYNGLQWNVGKISNNVVPVIERSDGVHGQPNDRNDEQMNGAMTIEISTSGYSRFRNRSSQNDQPESTDLPQSFPTHGMPPLGGVEAQAMFRRQLQASRDEIRPELRHGPYASHSSLNVRDSRPSFNFHKLSHQSEHDISGDKPTSKTTKMKHYKFRSPWDGICDFDVGVLGRSIKCKHTLAPATAHPRADSRSAQVSELRFNLPSSKALGPPPKAPSPHNTPGDTKRYSVFSPTQHQRQRSSFERYDHSQDCYDKDNDPDDGHGRMDLSLGQELAGGGFAGKQAKLGKLIIESEGMKMLDLVVAANIGLWWKVYERVV